VSGPLPADRGRESRGLVGPFTGRQIAVAVAAVGLVAVVLTVATAPITAPTPSLAPAAPAATQYAVGPAGEGLAVGQRPPELTLPGPGGSPVPAITLDGEPISLADLRGKVVWVDFWASWCPPCQAETPVLREVEVRHRDDGLAMVGVSVQESSADDVRRHVRTYGIEYPIVADLTGSIFRTWRVYGLPTQFLLDRNGTIRAVVQGPVDAETAESLVAPLLAEHATEPAATVTPGTTSTAP
jgi:thiol-disulfide isomerase/thioredoxin